MRDDDASGGQGQGGGRAVVVVEAGVGLKVVGGSQRQW